MRLRLLLETAHATFSVTHENPKLRELQASLELDVLRLALSHNDNNMTEACRTLGITKRTGHRIVARGRARGNDIRPKRHEFKVRLGAPAKPKAIAAHTDAPALPERA